MKIDDGQVVFLGNFLYHRNNFFRDYIVIDINEDDEMYESYASLEVSLDIERKDSMSSFNIGDEVSVYYDGNITETSPARIDKVYAILYIGDPK